MLCRFLVAGSVAIAAIAITTSPASADQPPKLHSVETDPFEASIICGDVVVTATGGTYTEKVEAVLVNGVIHYNLVRTYNDLTLAGSDGVTYRAASSAHETALISPDTGEPLSVREVGQTTIFGPNGALGYLHGVLIIEGANRTDTVTGTCHYASE
jgi:hypothetical protein